MKLLSLALSLCALAFSLTACEKEVEQPENQPPVVTSATDSTFRLRAGGNDTLTLAGSATDDGEVVGYAWTQISGPNTATIHYPGAPTTTASGFVAGSYVFQLMATDDKGATGVTTVTIMVTAPELFTITLQPAQNTEEMHLAVAGSTNISDPTASEFGAMAWTTNGAPYYGRGLLRFDWGTLPASATIVSAKLSLYSNPEPLNGNLEDANFGTNNSMLIQRLTSNWTSAITWQTQPSAAVNNQVTVPHTSQTMLDLIDLDVTALVNDMQQSGNYGFMLKLQNELSYNSRIFCSSKHPDAAKRPRLILQYSN